ncbi:ATP-binding protein [Azohydromonas caseinilytica]|uniref:histidine kinase n=1 Tax=Azohydromonas caseinilytica TaxID=2728836 RepID=A0A848FAZ9_9BURK|nr:ATP-binding protein [Azohydromonas caseinilytica]NML16502.1 HAMP domain-containing histidine kinase [Azohydromonas caseinilytica]
MAATEADALPAAADARQPEHLAGRKNLVQLVQLRWLAVGGQLLTILTVRYVLGIRLPLAEMLALLGALALFNVVCAVRGRTARGVSDAELFAGLLVDVTVLSGQLFYSGGITNPFIFLFLLQVVVAAVLLGPRPSWAMVALTSGCFIALTQWHRPLDLPGLAQTQSVHYLGGLLLCFALVASLLVLFIGRIGRNLRQRDERLANLRQRAAEEEHIVRIGLLASGAAHELGTPLATLSVILGDWSRMAVFAAEPELREEIDEMQIQLQRCKSIVSGILMAAGEARGEAPVETTLHAFLDELVAQWLRTRPAPGLRYRRDELPDLPIVSDTALKQMIGNVLDNALEAAPDAEPTLRVEAEDDELVLRVQDRGPGFAPEMLAQLGKPYQSSKGRPGGGLGLFLSINVARTLGGRLQARNRDGGGAEVIIRLPLAALTLQEQSTYGD